MPAKRNKANKTAAPRPAATAARRQRKPRTRTSGTKGQKGAAKAKLSGDLRTMAELTDEERMQMFAAVEATLREHGIADTLAEIHFASDELALLCPVGQVRRTVTFQCGPGVCLKNVCVPIPGGGL